MSLSWSCLILRQTCCRMWPLCFSLSDLDQHVDIMSAKGPVLRHICPFCSHCKNSLCAGMGPAVLYGCRLDWEGTICEGNILIVTINWPSVRCRTQNLWLWGPFSTAPAICKSLGQALNPHCLCPIMGTRLNENWYRVNGYSCRKCAAIILPKEM